MIQPYHLVVCLTFLYSGTIDPTQGQCQRSLEIQRSRVTCAGSPIEVRDSPHGDRAARC